MKTNWDYTKRAATYDKRANYSEVAINKLLKNLKVTNNDIIADIGAGTGKLTIPLLNKGLNTICVEPNNNMRDIGIKNTKNFSVRWVEGTGENTGLDNDSVDFAFFGSSFNVLDQKKTLKEVKRILKTEGAFACMWNHRDLNDATQREIEKIIKNFIPGYNYGNRRENPQDIIMDSKLFSSVSKIEENFSIKMSTKDIIQAWESHETLARQAKKNFKKIIIEIKRFLENDDFHDVPYSTKIWYAHLI
tara:strand:- start:336 stop:1076 length:741 start_codon:yes stop_codon:yes gene_type:complete